MRRGGYTWRRHTCPRCHAVYTTREYIEHSVSYRLRMPDGSYKPLIRDELFVMILDSLSHRKTSLTDASALTDTILGQVYAAKRLIIPSGDFFTLAARIIQRFDRTAYVKFTSSNQPLYT